MPEKVGQQQISKCHLFLLISTKSFLSCAVEKLFSPNSLITNRERGYYKHWAAPAEAERLGRRDNFLTPFWWILFFESCCNRPEPKWALFNSITAQIPELTNKAIVKNRSKAEFSSKKVSTLSISSTLRLWKFKVFVGEEWKAAIPFLWSTFLAENSNFYRWVLRLLPATSNQWSEPFADASENEDDRQGRRAQFFPSTEESRSYFSS